jgi:hypothetical protein
MQRTCPAYPAGDILTLSLRVVAERRGPVALFTNDTIPRRICNTARVTFPHSRFDSAQAMRFLFFS